MIGKLKKADGTMFKAVMFINILWIVVSTIVALIIFEELFLMGTLIGIGIAIISFVDYHIAGYFYFIGVDKGYKDKVYLRFAYFIPVVGHLLIIAMPDRANAVAKSVDVDELPEL